MDSERTCVCGHSIDDHGMNGTCTVDECKCGGFEEDDNDNDADDE